MIRKVQFESQERRINQVLAALKENGINSIEEANSEGEWHQLYRGGQRDL